MAKLHVFHVRNYNEDDAQEQTQSATASNSKPTNHDKKTQNVFGMRSRPTWQEGGEEKLSNTFFRLTGNEPEGSSFDICLSTAATGNHFVDLTTSLVPPGWQFNRKKIS